MNADAWAFRDEGDKSENAQKKEAPAEYLLKGTRKQTIGGWPKEKSYPYLNGIGNLDNRITQTFR